MRKAAPMTKYPRVVRSARAAELLEELLASARGGSSIELCTAVDPACKFLLCKIACGGLPPPVLPDAGGRP